MVGRARATAIVAGVALAAPALLVGPGHALAAGSTPAAVQGGAPAGVLDAAKRRLAEAREAYGDATSLAARLRHRAGQARVREAEARRDLGNFARAAYATGSSDLWSLAAMVDAPNPSASIRRAVMAEMVAEHQDAQWDDAVALVARVDDLRAKAHEIVHTARWEVKAASSIVRAITRRDISAEVGKGAAPGTGAAELLQRCLAADVLIDLCAVPPWNEQHLTFDAAVIGRYVNVHFPEVRDVGGWRPGDAVPDHPSGRAVDIMMPHGGSTAADVRLGNDVAHYFQRHAAEFGIHYMIWRQRVWFATNPVGQWTGMGDRGSATANHMDHVHISVTNGRSGSAFTQALLRTSR